ncbi:prepilin-type N-terminal cleavage/methylation domain-containing protein [Candidatus Dojkabacteria bacterium]|uniref:Prepilin-type N-terminal cleavage/methylation domain-containing protein n=1 Tax=Candidatus Dojkabacteria bacterium TaxID=2099670 RepID=A0A955RIH0_9BACT|nr:prepilin-type N-terminal cleavage/methylation domain-containing protein [Candidatus Dojkabacteria bacterium]
MLKLINKRNGFTLIEVIIVIALLAILSGSVFLVVKPFDLIEETRYERSITELTSIGKALELWVTIEGQYPPDVNRDLPNGIERYLNTAPIWPKGPYPGSVYDYDNWTGQTCIDPAASGSVQITLRQVPGFNPDGSNVWALYYVIAGKGTPHCSNANEWNKGTCINCEEQ